MIGKNLSKHQVLKMVAIFVSTSMHDSTTDGADRTQKNNVCHHFTKFSRESTTFKQVFMGVKGSPLIIQEFEAWHFFLRACLGGFVSIVVKKVSDMVGHL